MNPSWINHGYVTYYDFFLFLFLGLYSLGIYRKPGPQAAVNNLKSVLTSVGMLD